MKFSIGTIVSDWAQYSRMQNSMIEAGFCQSDCQYIPISNAGKNRFDMFSGGNLILSQASAEYIILCHQDIVANHDNRRRLEECLAHLDKHSPDWAVAGNAGARDGQWIVRISDIYGQNQRTDAQYPARVQILDGNFLVVRRNSGARFSKDLSGFHYYGWDICLNAEIMGYSSHVIDFHISHESKATPDPNFAKCRDAFAQKWRAALRPRTLGAFDGDKVKIG